MEIIIYCSDYNVEFEVLSLCQNNSDNQLTKKELSKNMLSEGEQADR